MKFFPATKNSGTYKPINFKKTKEIDAFLQEINEIVRQEEVQAEIMPFSTETVKKALIDRIVHLPYKASFKVELSKSAEHYISRIKTNTSEEKKRLNEIIDEILPYTTPWLALVLERKIKDLLAIDKEKYHSAHDDLRRYLSESMQIPEAKYGKETSLDKKAISSLMDAHSLQPVKTLTV